MSERQHCPSCGCELPAHSLQGLCPACLLGQALESRDEGRSIRDEPASMAASAIAPVVSSGSALLEQDQTANDIGLQPGGPSIGVMTDTVDAPGGLLDGHDEALEPGVRVRYFGDYALLKELGRGAMGVVYKARQITLDRLVALKMIKAGALAEEEDLRRFQNEAEAVARLDHPHIVPIYEVGEHEGSRYFSMKLVGGPCLQKVLARYAADPKAAAKLIVTVAEAVHHAHQRGILHRDLKPSNIVLDEQGQPHVTDFGLAKRVEGVSELTISGAVVGTPAYMAPEQASGIKRLVTVLSDVYGLGAILYAVLTGRAPFVGDSVEETLEQVRNSAPSPPSRINPHVPRDMETVCLKCLEKDPSHRYASADDLANDLKRWLVGEPIAARAVGNAARLWMWCRRRPAIAALSAALVSAVLGGLIGTSLGMVAALRARKEALQREQAAIKAQAKEREQAELANRRLAEAERARTAALYATLGDYGMANTLLQQNQANRTLDGELSIRVWGEDRLGLNVDDPKALPVTNGDAVHLSVRLSEPAYVYLIWVDSDGNAAPLYPWERRTFSRNIDLSSGLPLVQAPQQVVHSPSSPSHGWPMVGHSGLESVVLLVRRLPLHTNTDLGPLFRGLPPSPLKHDKEFYVMRFPWGMAPGLTSPSGTARNRIEPDEFDRILIKIQSHFDLVRIVRFAHVGDPS
jgi:tRNA A-37 threonylcarbamoyl transferase component Bud32